MKNYRVNEIFYSLQGEGLRAGVASVFVRLSGCNLLCDIEAGPKSIGGFKCDTEFVSGRAMTADQIAEESKRIAPACKWIILTGGEPALQVDTELTEKLHGEGYLIAIETNGSVALPKELNLDWVTVSPKVAEHALEQLEATEVKYVRAYGQGVPVPRIMAVYHLISPAFKGGEIDPEAMAWCVKLCEENPKWRLSIQQHKIWGVR